MARLNRPIGASASGDVFLPDDAVTQGFAYLARRRSGKSMLAGVIEETLCDRGDPWVCIDPVSAHWGIRYEDAGGKPGRASGYEVMIVGGKYGDVALDEKHGAALAQILVDTGISCVIDLGGESMNAQHMFVTDFASELLRLNETPRHVLLEEAHSFCPQMLVYDRQKLVRGALTKLITMGGGKGIGFSLITQRPASVAKDVLEQIDNLFVLRMSGPNDLKAVTGWFDHNVGDKAALREIVSTLPSFQPGEAWLLSPDWMHGMTRLRIRERHTYHAGRTPKRGEKPVSVKRVELGRVIEQFKSAAEKRSLAVTQERDLKAELAETRRKLSLADRQMAEASKRQVVAAPCDHEREIERLRDEIAERDDQMEADARARTLSDQALRAANAFRERIEAALTAHRDEMRGVVAIPARASAPRLAPGHTAPPRPPHRIAAQGAAPRAQSVNGQNLDGITGGAMRMLERLTERHPETWTRAQLATLAKVKKTGGTFGTYFSRLVQRGLIAERDGRVAITDVGLDLMGGPPAQPRTTAELVEAWRGRLTGGARRMLDALLDEPEGLTREDLAERASITPTGGTFGTYLSRLMTNGLVEKDGDLLVASDMLVGG